MAIQIASHGFWGRRCGTNHPTLGLIMPGKRASNKSNKHSGPHTKRQTRFRWPMRLDRMGEGNARLILARRRTG